jgi:hypothetical protein
MWLCWPMRSRRVVSRTSATLIAPDEDEEDEEEDDDAMAGGVRGQGRREGGEGE